MKWSIIPLFTVFLIACGTEQPTKPVTTDSGKTVEKVPAKKDTLRHNLIYPRQMTLVRKTAYDDFVLRDKDSTYYCNYKGLFQIGDTSGNNKRFLFDLQAEYLIDAVFFQPLPGGEFYISWQETDHRGVYSYYALYKSGASEPVWKYFIKAHSPGQPVIDSNMVYISSLGMIGKVELYSGEMVWQHDSLFDPISGKYKQFDKPLLYNNTVCFFDFPIKGKKSKRDSIWVNTNSGKIVR